jgi:hypothetical protein
LISVKIEGEHEIRTKLFDVPAGVTEEVVDQACLSLKSDVLASCRLDDSDLILHAITSDGKISVKFDLMKKEKFDCVVQAMQRGLGRIPEIATPVLGPLVFALVEEKKKRENPPA